MSKEISESSAVIKSVLEAIAMKLQLSEPKKLKVEVNELRESAIFTIQTHNTDYGKLCGQGGVTIRALQTLCSIIGNQQSAEQGPTRGGRYPKTRVVLDSPIPGERGESTKFAAATNWSNAPIKELAKKICDALFALPYSLSLHDAGDTTTLEIVPDAKEPALKFAGEIEETLTTIFHAVGKANGRNEIWLDIAPLTA